MKNAREILEELLLQKMGEPISDNPPKHLEFIDVHNATRIKIVVDEILLELQELLPKKRTHIGDDKIESCPMPHIGDSTCSGCNMTDEEIKKHNEKLVFETDGDKIYNQALADCREALKGEQK